ncbi:MAG: hypothetical protein Q4G03_12280, partial [Planctomycetia bacterium]|nr:hypothetical protein [Planctomycetia bacterium]
EIYDCEASLNLLEDYTNFAKLHEQRDLDYYCEDNLDDLEDRYMPPYFEHELSRGVVTLDLFDKKSYTYGVPKYFIYYGLEETNNISDWSKLFQAFCHRFYRVDPQAFSDCCDKFASSASPWIRRTEKKDRRFALSTKDYQMKNAKNVGGRYAVDVGLSWKRLFDAMRALFECRTIDVPLVIEYEERDELSELEKLEAILNRPQKKRVIKISSRHDLYRTTVKRLTVFHALENVDILPVSTRYDDGAVAKIDPHSWSRFVAATCSTLFQHMGPSISNANVQLKLGSLISFNSDGYGGYPKVETTDLFVDVSKLSTCKAALKFACDAIAKLGLSEDEFIIDFQTQDANSLSDDFLNLSEEEMTTYFPHLAALDQTQQDEEEDVEEEEEDDHSGALDALSDADFEEEDEEDEEYDLLSQERDAQTQNNVAVQVDAQSPAQFQEQNACLDVDAEPTRHDATRFSLDIPVGQGLLDTTPRDQIRNALSGSSYNPLLINRDLDKSVSPADNRHAHSDNTANSHVADAYNSSQSHNPLAIKAPRYSMPDALEEFDENPYNPLAIQSPSRKRQEEDVDLPDVTPSADLHIESQFDPLAETLTQPAPSDDFLIPNAPVAERPDSRQDLVAAVDTAESESDSYEDELLEKEPRPIVEAPFNLARFEDWLRSHRRLLARGRDRTIDQLRLFESRFLNKLDVFTTQTLLSGELHAIAKTLQRLLAKDEYKRYVYKAVKSYHTELEKLLNFLHEEIARVDDPNYVPEQLPQETDDAELEQQQSLSTDDSLATDLLNDLAESEATLEEEALPIVETPFDLQRFTAWLESRRKRSAHGRDKTIDQLRFFDSRFLSRRDDFPTQTVLSGELHALAQTIKRCLAKDAYNRYVYREVKSYRVELGKLLCFLNEEIARVDDPNYQPESQDLNVELTDAELEQRQELQDAQPIDSNVGDAGNEVENAPANDAANAPQTPCPEAKENDDAQVVAPTNLNATSPEPTSAPKQYAPLAFNLRDFRDYLQNDLRLAASDKSSVIMALRQVEKFTPFRKRALPAKSLLDGDLHAIARTVQLLIQDERFLKAVPIGGDLCKRYLTYLLDFCEHVRATAEVSDVQNVSEEPSTVEKAQDAIGTTQVIESNEVADSVPVESHDEIQSNSPTEPHRSSSTIHSLGQKILSRKELTTSQENDAFVKLSLTKASYADVLERAKEREPIPFSLFGFRVYLGRFARLNRNGGNYFVSRLREIEKSKPFRKRSLPSKKLREGDLYSIALTAQSLLEDATFLKELPFGYKDSERSLTYLYGYCVSELATKEAYHTQGSDNRQNTVATPLGTIESVEENAPQNITDANTQLDNKLEETTAQIESNDEPEKTPKEPTPQEVADSANEPEVVEEDSAPQEAVEANEVEHITGDVNDVNSVSANEPIFDRDDFMRWQTETLQYTSITASCNCVSLGFIEKRCLKTPSQSSSGQLLCGSLRGILRTIDALMKNDALSGCHDDLEKLNLLKRYVEEKLAQTTTVTEVASQDQALEEQTPMDEKNQIKTEITQVEEQSASEEPEQDQDVARETAQEPIGAQVRGAQEAPNASECANVEPPLPSGRLQDFAHWLASSRGYPQAKINQVRAALSSVDKALALAEYASDHNLHATLDAGEIPAIQALVECVQNDKTMCAYLDSIDRRHAQTLSLYGKYFATLAEARNQAHGARQSDASAPEEPSAQEVDVTPANATPQ